MARFIKKISDAVSGADSSHRRIAVSFLWISFFVFIGKFAGAAKEMAIAWRYGVSSTVDAYVFLFNLMSWPVAVWFSILTIVIVPLVSKLRKDDSSALIPFRSELFGFSIFMGVVLSVGAWLVTPFLLRSDFLGLSEEVKSRALDMASPMSLKITLGYVISLFSAWLMAHGKHRNTLLEALPALTIFFFLLVPPGVIPEPLVWGTVAGLAMQLCSLALPLKNLNQLSSPSFSFRSPAWKAFWFGIGVMAIGQTMTSLTTLVDQFFAADLGVGAISTLSYSNRILALISGMGAMAISRATLPVFSEARAAGNLHVASIAFKWAFIMFVGASVVALIVWMNSSSFVSIIYQRGAFTEGDTHRVAAVLELSMLQVPFYCAALVLVALLGSGRHYPLIALSGAANLVFKVIFATLLVKEYQLSGLVMSTVLMYMVSLIQLAASVLWITSRERKSTGVNGA